MLVFGAAIMTGRPGPHHSKWLMACSTTACCYPCWNPVLYQPPGDAPTLLFFKVGPTPSQWWGELLVSYDRGRTFVERRRLPEGIDGPVRCKPILLGDQTTLLCGSSTEFDGWRVHFESVKLTDGMPLDRLSANVWRRVGPINDATEFNAIQPTLLTHQDGRLQALCFHRGRRHRQHDFQRPRPDLDQAHGDRPAEPQFRD